MNARKAERLNGVRFAFAQGGQAGFKLVYVTPRIKVIRTGGLVEASWRPAKMPFRYESAPVLINNREESDIPILKRELRGGRRTTLEGQFASQFRARSRPVSAELGRAIIEAFERERVRRGRGAIAKSYVDALPYHPPVEDSDRARTYRSLTGRSPRVSRC